MNAANASRFFAHGPMLQVQKYNHEELPGPFQEIFWLYKVENAVRDNDPILGFVKIVLI